LSGGEALVHASGGNPITFFSIAIEHAQRGTVLGTHIFFDNILDTKETFWFVNDNRTAIRLHAILTFLGGSSALVRLVLLNLYHSLDLHFFIKPLGIGFHMLIAGQCFWVFL
jgi:hypothetical protein